jgi:pimeloyl-ACP methyl ester carboxylesterase
MALLQINNASLEVEFIEGPAGPAPIVFLHEGLGSVAMWRDWPAQVCKAAARAGMVYSRLGYGRSQSIPDVRGVNRRQADYMHREALDVLPALLQACGIERPVLLGHSDGATIALLHASRFPVSACIVMAPHVIVEEVALRAIEQARTAWESTDLAQRLGRYHDDPACAFRQWNDVWLSPAFRDFDIRAECRRITAPLLAIQGVNDEYGTLAQLDEIVAAAPQTQRLVLSDCGHSPQRDQSAAVLAALTEFLSDCP